MRAGFPPLTFLIYAIGVLVLKEAGTLRLPHFRKAGFADLSPRQVTLPGLA